MVKKLAWIGFTVIAVVLSVIAYLFYKPHRNVQTAKASAQISVKELLNEFSSNEKKANAKYLSADGNSKILIVSGPVYSSSTNQKNELVILLKEESQPEGVSCTFTAETNDHAASLKKGDIVKIKGAITAGNSYDTLLDLHNHALLIQCDIVK